MTFGYPEYLWALAVIPVGGVIGFFLLRNSLNRILSASGELRRKEVTNIYSVRYFVSAVLFAGALAGLVIAAAEPEWGEETVEDDRRGLEIAYVIDVSNSMLAEDIEPSRLARSRSVARAIAGRFPEAHSSVIIFKGAATVLVPMTEDSVAFELAMSNLSGGLITTAGTSIRDGLTAALDAFPEGSPRHRIVILFTDGDELQDSVNDISEELRNGSIPILTVQAGTSAGATIPLPTGGVLRDGDGNPVVVSVDESVLQRVADLTDGRLFRLTDTAVTQGIVDELQRRVGDGSEVLFRRTGEARYSAFVLISLLLLSLAVIIHSVPLGRKKRIE